MGMGVLLCFVAAASFSFVQPIVAKDDAWPPVLAPFVDNICNDVDCGNGTCKAYKNFTFTCECNRGWRRFHSDEKFRFLPCVIPNCSLNLKCTDEAAAPAPEPRHDNLSITDPCSWAYCGGGTCVKTSKFRHSCDCKVGFVNLFNISSFPCLSECVLGTDCAKLDVGLSNRSSASTTPSLSDRGRSSANHAMPSRSMLGPVMFMILIMLSWI